MMTSAGGREPASDQLHSDPAEAELTSPATLLEFFPDESPRNLHLQRQLLAGGLESAGIARVAARYIDQRDRPRVFTFVIKQLRGVFAREALVYDHLVGWDATELAPRVLATRRLGPERAVLYLEAVRRTSAWPWKEMRAAQSVLNRIAQLHAKLPSPEALAALDAWDYEADLQQTALLTLARLERLPNRSDLSGLRRGARWARRIAGVLPAMRRQLLTFGPLGRSLIHGDLHPGNAMIRRRGSRDEPILLDWARARLGSPLEDVSSWLHSVGCWEPEVRRRHDTLLASYLTARGMDQKLGNDLRQAYWIAGASNALAGALLHHITVATTETVTPVRRARADYSAREWLRVLRRADALWH